MDLQEGTRIGEYTLGTVLGEGAFGVVYLARDARDRECALKILRPELARERERFIREAVALSKIDHPGVVTVFGTGTIEGTSTSADGGDFIAMERLQGETLAASLARGPRTLTEPVAIDLARQIARAVGAAHATGIVHRDLKPQNIFLVPDKNGTKVKVLDFGIAKVWDPNAPPLTTAGTLGTAFYMSPEQCASTKDVDRRTDIYALGCILYEMLAGEPPFPGEDSLTVVMRHLEDPPPRAPGSNALAVLVSAMLAKSRDDRPSTMQVVLAALDACARSAAPPVAATLPPVFRPLPVGATTLPLPKEPGAAPAPAMATTLPLPKEPVAAPAPAVATTLPLPKEPVAAPAPAVATTLPLPKEPAAVATTVPLPREPVAAPASAVATTVPLPKEPAAVATPATQADAVAITPPVPSPVTSGARLAASAWIVVAIAFAVACIVLIVTRA